MRRHRDRRQQGRRKGEGQASAQRSIEAKGNTGRGVEVKRMQKLTTTAGATTHLRIFAYNRATSDTNESADCQRDKGKRQK